MTAGQPAAVPGTQLWVARYNGPANGDDEARSVAVSPSGGTVFVTGYRTAADGRPDYATVAYNAATGAELWSKRYNGPANRTDAATSVAVSPSGGTVFVTGYSGAGRAAGYDYATVAYNAATGAQLWATRHDTIDPYEPASSVAVSPTGSTVYVTGAGGTFAYNAATGAQLWAAHYLATYQAEFASMAVSPSGATVYVTGTMPEPKVYVTVAYNAATGAELWAKHYNGPAPRTSDGHARSVAVSPSGDRVFVTGYNGPGPIPAGYDYTTIAYSG